MSKGFYVLTRHQDVFDVSESGTFYVTRRRFFIWDNHGPGLEQLQANMGMRPPEHAAVKNHHPAFFAHVEMAPEIEALAARLLMTSVKR